MIRLCASAGKPGGVCHWPAAWISALARRPGATENGARITGRIPAYDDNDDGTLDREEYGEAVDHAIATDAYFEGFDRDRSGGLSESGFADGIFGVYDADGSDSLDESEFESAVSALNVEL